MSHLAQKLRSKISWWPLFLVIALLALAPVQATQAHDDVEIEPVADGFNGPQGVLVDPDGNIWVIEAGVGGETEVPFVDPATGEAGTAYIGETARIVKVAPDGTQTEVAVLPSILAGEEANGGARLALLDGVLYATSGGWIESAGPEAMPLISAIVEVDDGEVSEVVNTWPLETEDNPDGFILESHPYGLAAGPDGMLWVAEAGANTLLRVDPGTGAAEIVAVFDGVPSPMPNPNRGDALESDPVPTGVVVDDDGAAYVSLLPGFPFAPGSARVVMVDPEGAVNDYATGLTMLTDLRRGPDGDLYAVQFGEMTEQGPTPDSGAIIRVGAGDSSEVVVHGLSFPTSIGFDAAGDAYITINGVGAPGSGAVVKVAGLTDLPGEPMAGEMPAHEDMTELNLATVQRLYDEFAAGNADVILDTHAMTITMHYAGSTDEVPAQALADDLAALKAANPDLHAEIHDMFAAGDYVFTDLTWTATHTGDYFGVPATGETATHPGIVVRRLEDGKIVESWEMFDDLAFMQSLGYLPSWDDIVADGSSGDDAP